MYIADVALAVAAATNTVTLPHYIMGYSLSEWLEVFSMVAMFISLASWLIRIVIIKPLYEQISNLSVKIDNMNNDKEAEIHAMREVINQHSEMLQEHNGKLIKNEEKLKTLFRRSDY